MEHVVLDYLLNPKIIPSPYLQMVDGFRIAFILLTLALFSLIAYILISTSWLKYRAIEDVTEFVKFQPYGSDKYVKEWRKIAKRLDSGIEAEYKLAVIEIDTMLGEILKQMGHNEGTIDKSLSKISSIEINNIKELRDARKIRDDVVHDPDYQLSKDKAKEVMSVYEDSFRGLGLI